MHLRRRPINLLDPQTTLPEPNDQPPLPPRKTTLLLMAGFIFFILVFVAILAVRHGQANGGYAMGMLEPQPTFFQTITNLVFHTVVPPLSGIDGVTDDRLNILILGVGGPGHDGPYLSDTNIIASIKPSTGGIALISIPRDLGVQIPGHGSEKINAVDAFGEAQNPGNGGEYARQFFSSTFNIPIPYYVRVDFTAFSDIINDVGGITIDVPTAFTDSQYPTPDNGPNPNGYETIHFDAGVQTMDGEQALEFARSRHGTNGEDSDFARARRQQLVLQALKQKVLSSDVYLNPLVLGKIFSSLAQHITTNLSLSQVLSLADFARTITSPPRDLVFDNSVNGYLISTTADNGAYMLSPKSGNFDTMTTAINTIFDSTVTSSPAVAISNGTPSASINETTPVTLEIQNGTWRAGLASRVRQSLQNQGFFVSTIGNTVLRPIDTSTVYVLNQSAAAISAARTLSQNLAIPIAGALPNWLEASYDNPSTTDNETGMKYDQNDDILIILGNDFNEANN